MASDPPLSSLNMRQQIKIGKMMGFNETSSPPTMDAPASAPAPNSAATNGITRAASFRSSFRRHLPSPLRHVSRRLSVSPLATKNSQQSLDLKNNNTTDVTGTMLTPDTPSPTLRNKAFIPLSVRTSSLHPFDFDPVKAMEAMEAMENGEFALPSPGTKTTNNDSMYDRAPRDHSPAASKASSDTISAPKKHAIEDESVSALDPGLDELQHATRSLRLSPPTPGTNNLSRLINRDPLVPRITPSKNNLGNLVREMQAKREDSSIKDRATSQMTPTSRMSHMGQNTVVSNPVQVRHSSLNATTPKKSLVDEDSLQGGFKELLSPRSVRTSRSFTPAEFFGPRTPSKSKDQEHANEIMGDLEFLRTTQPAPDLSQHPMTAADPFTSRSSAPQLSSAMNAVQARQWAIDHWRERKERWTENQVRPFVKGEPFPVFKQPDWITREEERVARQVAEAARNTSQSTRPEILASEASPLPKTSNTPKTPLRIDTKIANAPTSDIHAATRTATPLGDDLSKKSATASLRSLSGLFKGRSGTDRWSLGGSAHGTVSPEEKKEESRADKERFLRIKTNCRSFDYNPTSAYPRHPNTGRDWMSRNLRCAGCQWITCKCCGRACCARAACFFAMENHKENPEGLERAKETKEMIESVIPVDREVQTFLTCTSCNREVCPDCCGICPLESCQDIQCRICKRGDPWNECDWHKDLANVPAEANTSNTD